MKRLLLSILLLSPLSFLGASQTKSVVARVTAYCPCSKCCGHRAKGVTASGGTAWKKGIAADGRFAAFGTVIHVPEYGLAQVDDRGRAMKKSYDCGIIHLDIRFGDHEKAKRWGSRWMNVTVFD